MVSDRKGHDSAAVPAVNLTRRDGLILGERAAAARRAGTARHLPFGVASAVALLAALLQATTAAALPAKRCMQDCTKEKRLCRGAFKRVFRETNAGVCRHLDTPAERKECIENGRKALRRNWVRCNVARSACVACCGSGDAGAKGCSVGVCGNGLRSGTEQCDAGRANSDTDADACRTTCEQSRCGDGVADKGEQCDRDSIAAVCTDPRFASPTFAGGVLRCTAGCAFDTSGCIAVGCGNGVQEPRFAEECDEGADNSDTEPDACRKSCRKAACGDGVTDGGEQCDDRDANSDSLPDACRTNCQEAHCGDGTADAGEECDGGVGGRTCADGTFGGQFSGGDLRCTPTCRFNTSGCRPASCGNGDDENGEECDDGNDRNGDGCDVNCTNTRCGNGIRAGMEECDDGVGNSNVAPNACRTSCRRARCGDGVKDSGEQCDQGGGNSDTGANACRTDCRAAHCGDGVKDSGEQCDQGGGNSDTRANACRTDCQAARCGDGVKDNGEECDSGTGNSDTQPNACRTSCLMPGCGDGVTDPIEDEDIDIGPIANSSDVFCCFGPQSRPHQFGQTGCNSGGCHTRTPTEVQQGPVRCLSVCPNGDCEAPTCLCD
jgi:cysteine-rich repeat protein